MDGSLKLSNNGGAPVTVSASGSFAFPTALATGAAYSVSIAALPSKQNCVLTNPRGTVSTANVVNVGVSCTTRAWTIGQQIDGDDQSVGAMDAGMDQDGRVIAVFSKGPQATARLYAVLGTPGAAGQAVQWSAPVRIDTDSIPFRFTGSLGDKDNLSLAVAPNGNANAVWGNRAPCGLAYEPAPGTCLYIYSSTYTATSNTWGAPVLIADTPSVNSNSAGYKPIPSINNQGDVAVVFRWYSQVAPVVTSSSNQRAAIAWRAAGQTAFQRRVFTDFLFGFNVSATLDNAGGMVVAGEKQQSNSSNDDIVAYVGTVAAGFAATEGAVVDNLGNNADLGGLKVGPTGDILLTWEQNDTAGAKVFAASKTSASAAWSTPVAIATRNISSGTGFVTATGDALFYASCSGYVRPKATGVWASKAPALPTNCDYNDGLSPFSVDGSYLSLNSGGAWNVYNQVDNTMSRLSTATLGASDYLLGFSRSWGNISNKRLYTQKPDGNYIGAYLSIEEFDTLPTPTATSGDGRNGIANLWGFYLK